LGNSTDKNTLEDLGESGIIEFIQERSTTRAGPHVIKGIGDDCAVLEPGEGTTLLVTTDTLVEGIHFRQETLSSEALGWKVLAVNVSDIAAMGGSPHTAFLSVGLNRETEVGFLESFMDGFTSFAERAGVVLAGGDTVESPSFSVVTVTLLGNCMKGHVVYRSGARVGDDIWLTGHVGDAAGGLFLLQEKLSPRFSEYEALILAHQRPRPPFELGKALGESGWVNAMIDISDGIAKDLGHICEESVVGATLQGSSIPVSETLMRLSSELQENPLAWALHGGEDYQLLFTAPPAREQDILSLNPEGSTGRMAKIGTIIQEGGIWLETAVGRDPLESPGFLHFSK
jgi:thiamine-monophosphate kinase